MEYLIGFDGSGSAYLLHNALQLSSSYGKNLKLVTPTRRPPCEHFCRVSNGIDCRIAWINAFNLNEQLAALSYDITVAPVGVGNTIWCVYWITHTRICERLHVTQLYYIHLRIRERVGHCENVLEFCRRQVPVFLGAGRLTYSAWS